MTSEEKTFRAFSAEQAAQYAAGRGGSYPEPLYQAILEYLNGKHELFLDVGTGPGNAVWDFIRHFEQGIGCDTSVQMIEQAKKDAAQRGLSDRVKFVVCGGEECAEALSQAEESEVDLITVAMAAHWMDLPAFYSSAAKALRPGGTLAMWTASSFYCHPSERNHKAIQDALSNLEDNLLGPYMTPGNLLTHNAYKDLTLPWDVESTRALFQKDSFSRKDWDLHGVPSADPLPDGTPGPFLVGNTTSLHELQQGLGSASAVVRWREANPQQAHSEDDPVLLTVKRLRNLSGDGETLMMGPSYTLLLLRRS